MNTISYDDESPAQRGTREEMRRRRVRTQGKIQISDIQLIGVDQEGEFLGSQPVYVCSNGPHYRTNEAMFIEEVKGQKIECPVCVKRGT